MQGNNKKQTQQESLNSEGNEIIQKNSQKNFPSGEIMLSMVLKEYEYEGYRYKGLQSRTGMLMAFVGALLVFLPNYFKILNLSKVKVNNAFEAMPYVILVILFISGFISLIASIIYFVRVISTEEYRRLSFDGFNEKNAMYEKDKLAVSLMIKYKSIVEYNHKKINKKVELYKKGIYMIIISIILITSSFIISLFINQ